jgi:heme A synthase
VSVLVAALAGCAWWLRKGAGSTERDAPGKAAYAALGLLVVQVLLGAITVRLELPPWSVVLHLGTAMLLLATLLIAASPRTPAPDRPHPLTPSPFGRWGTTVLVPLAFVTVLLGALTANLGAAAACGGFPLCNGQVWVTAGPLALIQWTHRLLAYALTVFVFVAAARSGRRGMWGVAALVLLQVALGAATVLLGLPGVLQAAHVAVGAAVWAGVILAVASPPTAPSEPRHVLHRLGAQ